MTNSINPFHNWYNTDSIKVDRFVEVFSPGLVELSSTEKMFLDGNVVIKGAQGSGKTMLLSLLKPQVRIAYAKKGIEFPVKKQHSKFLSGGINFRRAGVTQFSQLILSDSTPRFIRELSFSFADFINYWIVRDLISNLKKFIEYNDKSLLESIGINDNLQLDEIVRNISKNECWFGYFDEVNTVEDFIEQIDRRIITYRNYMNLNIDNLPDEIVKTRTTVGQPITRVAKELHNSGFINSDVKLFIRLDSYEELELLDNSKTGFGISCQTIVHRALYSRDDLVSYRIGSRHYAWPRSPKVSTSEGFLELRRDFEVLDIDEILRPRENQKTANGAWIFEGFAQDIFRKRLKSAGHNVDEFDTDLLTHVFGRSLTIEERVEKLAPPKDRRSKKLMKKLDIWPESWNKILAQLYKDNPLNGKYAEAWVKQKAQYKKDFVNIKKLPSTYPWDNKTHWKSERSEQAVMQIASRNQQKLFFYGKTDLLYLSGGSIFVFLKCCQEIWDIWNRMSAVWKLDNNKKTNSTKTNIFLEKDSISNKIQSLAIFNASQEFFGKRYEGAFLTKRKEMIELIGTRYHEALIHDDNMSYPGYTGFSLLKEQIENNKDISDFLKSAVDYGDLIKFDHTSKNIGETRFKYYLAPILCPHYGLPFRNKKEPEYINAALFKNWLDNKSKKIDRKSNRNQLNIPGI